MLLKWENSRIISLSVKTEVVVATVLKYFSKTLIILFLACEKSSVVQFVNLDRG